MTDLDLARLDALIGQQERAVRNAFRDYIATVGQDGPVLAAILLKLEEGDAEAAMVIVESHIARLGNVLPAIAQSVGLASAAELAGIVPDAAIGISFDPSHPRAAEIIRNNRLRFVREFTDQQRRATWQSLQRGYREGAGTAEIARAFRESIGLTSRQEQAVANYRQLLRNLDRQALDRSLRDRRFDSTVGRAIENGQPLTEDQITRMTERYRKRFLAMRAETIARTEGGRATSEAREETLAQMIETTGIDPARVERVWNPTGDGRTRDFHASMRGQKRKVGEKFRDGHGNLLRYPHDPDAPAETTINCRCGLTFSVAPVV